MNPIFHRVIVYLQPIKLTTCSAPKSYNPSIFAIYSGAFWHIKKLAVTRLPVFIHTIFVMPNHQFPLIACMCYAEYRSSSCSGVCSAQLTNAGAEYSTLSM